MTQTNLTLEVDRNRLDTTRFVTQPLALLTQNHVRLRIDRVALTANTVTYAVTGEQLGYWDFYPAAQGWGRVPAMGWAEVVESTHPDIAPGGRYYGWYPFARYVDLAATPTTDGLRDDGAHRAAHAPVYRAFSDTRRDAYYQAGADTEDRQALLRGLFLTGFLADDFFADNAYFGASRCLVLSASSKTAIAFAQCARQRAGLELVGVTSAANRAFVGGLGCYDRVLSYEEIESLPNDRDAVSIDMSGNGLVLARVHTHFGDRLRHSMAIGRSHHESPPRAAQLPGPRPAFFFAPTQVKKRTQDWGPVGFRERSREALWRFVDDSRRWLGVEHVHGPEATRSAWQDAVAARIPAASGWVVSMWD